MPQKFHVTHEFITVNLVLVYASLVVVVAASAAIAALLAVVTVRVPAARELRRLVSSPAAGRTRRGSAVRTALTGEWRRLMVLFIPSAATAGERGSAHVAAVVSGSRVVVARVMLRWGVVRLLGLVVLLRLLVLLLVLLVLGLLVLRVGVV